MGIARPLMRPGDAKRAGDFGMHRDLQPAELIKAGARPVRRVNAEPRDQILHQQGEDLAARVIGRVEYPPAPEIVQDMATDGEPVFLIHRQKAPLLEIVQPHAVDNAGDGESAIGLKTPLPDRGFRGATGRGDRRDRQKSGLAIRARGPRGRPARYSDQTATTRRNAGAETG